MQSVRAGAVQTYLSIFTFFLKNSSNKPSFWLHFRYDFCLKLHLLVKKGLQQNVEKKCPDRLKRDPIPESQGSWTATPRSKISRTRNNYLSKKQEQLLISESISEPLSWNGLFSSSRYSFSDSKWQFIFDLLHLWKDMAGDLTRPGQGPASFSLSSIGICPRRPSQ